MKTIAIMKRRMMKIVTNLHRATTVIAEPQHHLRLGCGRDWNPGWAPLDQWLRARGVRCRLHGPYYSEFLMFAVPYDENSLRFIEFEGPEDPEDGRWIDAKLSFDCARLVEFLDPADEIRHRDALVAAFGTNSPLAGENFSMRMEFGDLHDTAFDPDRTIKSVRKELLGKLVRIHGGLPGQHRTITIGGN